MDKRCRTTNIQVQLIFVNISDKTQSCGTRSNDYKIVLLNRPNVTILCSVVTMNFLNDVIHNKLSICTYIIHLSRLELVFLFLFNLYTYKGIHHQKPRRGYVLWCLYLSAIVSYTMYVYMDNRRIILLSRLSIGLQLVSMNPRILTPVVKFRM